MKVMIQRCVFTCCLFVLAALSSTKVMAQYVDVTINPLSALTGTAVIMAEVPVAPSFGVELQSSYFFKARRAWTPDYSTEGYRIGALAHYYFDTNREHAEWSIFAYGRYLDVRYEDNGSPTIFDRDNYTFSKISVGMGGSYKHVFREHFVLGAGIGLGRNFAKKLVREEGEAGDFLSLGLQTRVDIDVYARVTIGYRFRYTMGS
jgi:hypothetical protein